MTNEEMTHDIEKQIEELKVDLKRLEEMMEWVEKEKKIDPFRIICTTTGINGHPMPLNNIDSAFFDEKKQRFLREIEHLEKMKKNYEGEND